MRIVFFLLVFIPFASFSQINRSANQLAQESIEDYITHKIFRGQKYKPVSYKDIQSARDGKEIWWKVSHRFEIKKESGGAEKKSEDWQPYFFTFYLDRKLRVLKAEGYQ